MQTHIDTQTDVHMHTIKDFDQTGDCGMYTDAHLCVLMVTGPTQHPPHPPTPRLTEGTTGAVAPGKPQCLCPPVASTASE